MPIQVFVAHTGATFEVATTTTTTVHDILPTLSTLTNINSPHDIILTCNGSQLLPHSHLIPNDDSSSSPSHDIFLYDKSLLRHDAPMPQLESLPPLPPHVSSYYNDSDTSSSQHPQQQNHPLDTASSPLLRSLPQYYRQFHYNLNKATQASEIAILRLALCCRLVNAAEVQAMAVDAAMSAVESHYNFICNAQSQFAVAFSEKYSLHDDVLRTFDKDVELLQSIALPIQLQQQMMMMTEQQHVYPGKESEKESRTESKFLSDLVDIDLYRKIAVDCTKSHRHFAKKVKEIDALHAALRSDVEALFMRTPTVDLDGLSQGLTEIQNASEEISTAVLALQNDCSKVEHALEMGLECISSSSSTNSNTTTTVLSSSSSSLPMSSTTSTTTTSTTLSTITVPQSLKDSISIFEALLESQSTTTMPMINQHLSLIQRFTNDCIDAKNTLSVDAIHTLRTIAAQQSKIRETKEILPPFSIALEKQDERINRLLYIRRLPIAYKQCLDECGRRHAFQDKFSSVAADLAERMSRFREKESMAREKFRLSLGNGNIPECLYVGMGLHHEPPYCQVIVSMLSVSAEEELLQKSNSGSGGSSDKNISSSGGGVIMGMVSSSLSQPSTINTTTNTTTTTINTTIEEQQQHRSSSSTTTTVKVDNDGDKDHDEIEKLKHSLADKDAEIAQLKEEIAKLMARVEKERKNDVEDDTVV